MGDDVFVEEESNWKGETRGECRSLIRRRVAGGGGDESWAEMEG